MISVVICTYNRDSLLRHTLVSLTQIRVPADVEWELIVVDNNSRDKTREVVEEVARSSGLKIRYIFEALQGKSHALNTGIREARGEIIAFTDDDVIVEEEWLVQVKKAFDEFDCIGVAGKTIPLWSSPKPSWLSESGPFALENVIVSFDLGEEPLVLRTSAPGCNLSFRRTAFDKYGGFRTDLGPGTGIEIPKLLRTVMSCEVPAVRFKVGGAGEDTELFYRLTNSGERIVYYPKSVVFHPVEKVRTQKAYYRYWSFHKGLYYARLERVPPDTVCYFGVPRYLFRMVLQNMIAWLLWFPSRRRFYYELQVCCLTAQILERRRLVKKRPSSTPAVENA